MIDEFGIDDTFSLIEKDGQVSIISGRPLEFNSLKELEEYRARVKQDIVFILPFSLARENGHNVIGNEPILAIEVETEIKISKEDLLRFLPNEEISHGEIVAGTSDEDFSRIVSEVKGEIDNGNICQAVISREFTTAVDNFDMNKLATIYRRLLGIYGSYMTFMFVFGGKAYTGASPEVHLEVTSEKVIKRPIAGTIPKFGKLVENIKKLLNDKKEENELLMITDEELKDIIKISYGGEISGTMLREIGAVIHTEIGLEGIRKQGLSAIDCLRHTLHSKTIVGGPGGSAFEIIAKYENESRRYYGTAMGRLGSDDTLDTCIPIRTAEVDLQSGKLSVRSGAGIVNRSDPDAEVLETIKKAEGFLGVLSSDKFAGESELDKLGEEDSEEINDSLLERQKNMSKFYLDTNNLDLTVEEIKGKDFILINNEDDFAFMLGYMIKKMGGNVRLVDNKDFDEESLGDEIVILGPGPGDINDPDSPKMTKLLDIASHVRQNGNRMIGICLGHQALSRDMGLSISHQENITQGEQIDLELFGETQKLAFYNSFSPEFSETTHLDDSSVIGNRLIYFRKGNVTGSQFHPESIMSVNGFDVLKKMILGII